LENRQLPCNAAWNCVEVFRWACGIAIDLNLVCEFRTQD
jgi:hypothetical protein